MNVVKTIFRCVCCKWDANEVSEEEGKLIRAIKLEPLGDIEAVKKILPIGAGNRSEIKRVWRILNEIDPNRVTWSYTSQRWNWVHWAIYYNRLDILKYMIEEVGIDVNICTKRLPIESFKFLKYLWCCKCCDETHWDTDNNALQFAVRNFSGRTSVDIVEYILSKNPIFDRKNLSGKVAIQMADKNSSFYMVLDEYINSVSVCIERHDIKKPLLKQFDLKEVVINVEEKVEEKIQKNTDVMGGKIDCDIIFKINEPQDVISKGGFGIIYKGSARIGTLKIPIAVKTDSETQEKQKFVKNEYELIVKKQLIHRNLLEYLGTFTDPNIGMCVAMRLCHGDLSNFLEIIDLLKENDEDKNNLLNKFPPLTIFARKIVSMGKKEVVKYKKNIVMQIVMGIRYLHQKGIVHSVGITVKICDFGTTKLLSEISGKTFCGTQGFVPPEYTNNSELPSGYEKKLTDVFCFGKVVEKIFEKEKNLDYAGEFETIREFCCKEKWEERREEVKNLSNDSKFINNLDVDYFGIIENFLNNIE